MDCMIKATPTQVQLAGCEGGYSPGSLHGWGQNMHMHMHMVKISQAPEHKETYRDYWLQHGADFITVR